MAPVICGLWVNKMNNEIYFKVIKFLSLVVIILNVLLFVLVSTSKCNITVLAISQLSFILFIYVSYHCIKKTFSNYFNALLNTLDRMMSQESVDNLEPIDHTYISQIYHKLNRLYDILQAQQHSIVQEKNRVQSFVSDISHQLKTPITNLKLLQDSLKQQNLAPKEHQKYLNTQEKQINKIDFLIQSLLKTSQLENGLIHIQPRHSSIGSTILSSLEGVLISAAKKDIEIHYDNTTDYIVMHDPKWTAEALFNIMENAIKYTPKSGQLTILLNKTEKYIKITIKDNGMGIPPSDLPKIFIRFWRGDTNISEGNGIGLYLSKQIISLQHGYILANSAVDIGSEFQIFLPL